MARLGIGKVERRMTNQLELPYDERRRDRDSGIRHLADLSQFDAKAFGIRCRVERMLEMDARLRLPLATHKFAEHAGDLFGIEVHEAAIHPVFQNHLAAVMAREEEGQATSG